uniref:Putative drillipeptide CvEx14.2 n=1 Tax=Clavus sp. n. QL-2020 TaxID=2720206 RepID=A0A6M3H8S3_9CAEN|nr:putative drillipeptide precursor CvEx14.2 [Clavus sp. n. QL-2020]
MAAMKGVFFSCMIVLLITACLGSPHERNTRESEGEEEQSLGKIVRTPECSMGIHCDWNAYCMDGRCHDWY